jgi:hypothetical protein
MSHEDVKMKNCMNYKNYLCYVRRRARVHEMINNNFSPRHDMHALLTFFIPPHRWRPSCNCHRDSFTLSLAGGCGRMMND